MRAFVGIALDDAARAVLAPSLAAIHETLPDARVADVLDLHVTLAFLGEVDAVRVTAVATALAGMGMKDVGPGTAAVDGLDTFPADGPPRTLYARVVDAGGHLSLLAHHVGLALATVGFPTEPRPFVPHVTLARLDRQSSQALDALRAVVAGGALPGADAAVGSLTSMPASTAWHPRAALATDTVALFESRGGSAPRYHALVSFPLATPAPGPIGPPVGTPPRTFA